MDQQSGWYPDPDGIPGRLRWWDGDRWTDLATSAGPLSGEPAPAGPAEQGADTLVGPGGAPTAGRLGKAVGQRLRPLRRFNRIPGVAVALAVVVVLAVALVARNALLSDAATDTAAGRPTGSALPAPPVRPVPPLAASCLAGQPTPSPGPDRPVPPGPRVVDSDAGISYARMGPPWKPWDQFWFDPVLRVRYGSGYYLVTQHNVAGTGTDYYATVLSGSVPATVGDALHPDMACVAKQVADDVKRSFYPQPNTRQQLLERPVQVDGHPAYLIKFHLSFDSPGYNAKGELAEVLVVDVGTPRVAVLYVSIPDTHKQYDALADRVVASVSVP